MRIVAAAQQPVEHIQRKEIAAYFGGAAKYPVQCLQKRCALFQGKKPQLENAFAADHELERDQRSHPHSAALRPGEWWIMMGQPLCIKPPPMLPSITIRCDDGKSAGGICASSTFPANDQVLPEPARHTRRVCHFLVGWNPSTGEYLLYRWPARPRKRSRRCSAAPAHWRQA